jgi:hypothetical protein
VYDDDYSDRNQKDFEKFKCLRSDKYFVNNTKKDLLLIYPDGTMTIAMSNLKFHNNIVDNKDECVTLEMDGSLIPESVKSYTRAMNSAIDNQISELTYGCPQLIEKYYYGVNGEHIGEYREIPTVGHPVLVKSTTTFLLILYDDMHSINVAIRDIMHAGSPKAYVSNYLSDEFHLMGVGIRYINFSPFDLYYASHDNRQVSLLRHMRREEAIRYIQKSRDWTIIDNFSAELEEGNFIILGIIENGKLRLHKFEREENCTLASGSLQFADASRSEEILPIFYRRRDAEIFLEDYDANVSNVYLDAAVSISEKRTDEAVSIEVENSKKNMTAIAKICAAMVTTGVAYGVGRAAIEALIKGKDKEEKMYMANKIIMKNNFGNMLRKSMAGKTFGTFAKKSFITGAVSSFGVTSAFASPMSVGLTSAATVLGIACPIVIAGAVIVSTIILCHKHKDKIEEFLDDHPVADKIVTGLKVAGAVALGIVVAPIVVTCVVVKKVWEGIKRFGSWLGGLFGI